MTAADASCLRARLLSQRAYHLTAPAPGEQADVAAAQRLFEAIEIEPALPFVCFRRDNGLAYCAWELGDRDAGMALARRAAEHAGDGGLVRFRIMALILESKMHDDEDLVARASASNRR